MLVILDILVVLRGAAMGWPLALVIATVLLCIFISVCAANVLWSSLLGKAPEMHAIRRAQPLALRAVLHALCLLAIPAPVCLALLPWPPQPEVARHRAFMVASAPAPLRQSCAPAETCGLHLLGRCIQLCQLLPMLALTLPPLGRALFGAGRVPWLLLACCLWHAALVYKLLSALAAARTTLGGGLAAQPTTVGERSQSGAHDSGGLRAVRVACVDGTAADCQWESSVAVLHANAQHSLLAAAALERMCELVGASAAVPLQEGVLPAQSEHQLAVAMNAGLAVALLDALRAAQERTDLRSARELAQAAGDCVGPLEDEDEEGVAAVRLLGLRLLRALAAGSTVEADVRRTILSRAGAFALAVAAARSAAAAADEAEAFGALADAAVGDAVSAEREAIACIAQILATRAAIGGAVAHFDTTSRVEAALEAGVPDVLLHALRPGPLGSAPARLQLRIAACLAIARLASFQQAAVAAGAWSSRACEAVSAAMLLHGSHVPLLLVAAPALANLCAQGADDGESAAEAASATLPSTRQAAAAAGALEQLAVALRTYAAGCAPLALHISIALCNVCAGEDREATQRRQRAVYDAGALRALAAAMDAHPTDGALTGWACAAVAAVVGVRCSAADGGGVAMRQQAAVREGALAAAERAIARYGSTHPTGQQAARAADAIRSSPVSLVRAPADASAPLLRTAALPPPAAAPQQATGAAQETAAGVVVAVLPAASNGWAAAGPAAGGAASGHPRDGEEAHLYA